MNQNRTVFDIDEETDAFYLQKAVEYHEWLIQQEAQPRLTRTPTFRDREDAERRLCADYFDDHSAIRQMAIRSHTRPFEIILQMSSKTARDALFFFNMCIIELYMPKMPLEIIGFVLALGMEKSVTCHGKVIRLQWRSEGCAAMKNGTMDQVRRVEEDEVNKARGAKVHWGSLFGESVGQQSARSYLDQ
ncbi:hypothetical protein Tco_0744557 [Tanacetum coccineum]